MANGFGKIVYISGALTDVPAGIRADYISFYEEIGHVIESFGLVPYIPHQHTDPVRHKNATTPQVDKIDRRAVTSAMLVVVVLDNPSIGVGIEIEMAYHANKPVVFISHKDRLEARLISRLPRGNPAMVHEIVYGEKDDALEELDACVKKFLATIAEDPIMPAALKPALG